MKSGDSLDSLNAMCGAIAKLDQKDRAKLEAVIIFAEPENAGEICRLAENLDQFDFIPGVHTPKEYGKYMIQESGRFGYDDHLDAFYDYEGYGQHRIQQEKWPFQRLWLCVLFRSNGSGGIDVGRPGRSISSATGPSVGENRMRHLKLRTICRGGVHKEIGLNGAAVISCIFKAKKFR